MAWSLLLLYKLFVSVVCVFVCLGTAKENESCSPGVVTHGVTIPKGDIMVEEGSSFEIYCKLHDDYVEQIERSGGVASENITFYRNNDSIPDEMIVQVNKSTIRLYQSNLPPSTSYMYYCKNKIDHSAICLNAVTVGIKPQEVKNFSCYGINFKSLICSWIVPQNYVKTNYTLDYYFAGRGNRQKFECPKYYPRKSAIEEGAMKCVWEVYTDPPYRQSQEMYFFTLTMINAFGNRTFRYNFSHFANVIPGPPENLTYINRTHNSILLTWNTPSDMIKFPPGLVQKVVYRSEYDDDKWHESPPPIGLKNETYIYNLTGLKYAHALYDIRVSMRSAKALDKNPNTWSNFSSITVRTASSLPAEPPRINIGSFETMSTGLYRDIYVYWQYIEEYKKNGENFTYTAVGYENNDKSVVYAPVEVTNAYAKFTNLSLRSHTFVIVSSNEIGNSTDASVIRVPNYNSRIPKPKEFYKIAFKNSLYELSWQHPENFDGIVSYTIFWCSNKRDRPYQCNGYLDWEEVSAANTSHNVTVPENGIYQFAISANTRNASSGMIWASCTVLHNSGLQRMKTLWIDKIGSTFIEVRWNLECADKKANIKEYKIEYCQIVSPTEATCKESVQKLSISDPNAKTGRVTGLKPYTTYMLTVSVLNKHDYFSLKSDPLFNTTLEGVPDAPQNLSIVNITHDSITIKWSQPKEIRGVLKEYQLKISGNIYESPIKTNDLVWTFEKLNSYTDYNISVQACTVKCSSENYLTNIRTSISEPSMMEQPITSIRNASTLTFIFKAPTYRNGELDYYQLRVKESSGSKNETIIYNATKLSAVVTPCKEKHRTYYYSVRAVNVDSDKVYYGKWSPELVDTCEEPSNVIYYAFIVGTIFFFAAVLVLGKKLWTKCKIMRDVEIKLPPGLSNEPCDIGMPEFWPTSNKIPNQDMTSKTSISTDEERLLKKNMTNEFHGGDIMNGDSSGCSSGKESVISSEESENNMSFTMDSGTEQPKTPSNDSISRENSLRLRKPGSDATSNHNWNTETWPNKKSGYVTMPTPEKIPTSNWTTKRPAAVNNYCVFGLNSEPEINPSYVAIGQDPNAYMTSNVVMCNMDSSLNLENPVGSMQVVSPTNPILSHNNQTGYSSIIPVNNFAVNGPGSESSLPYMQKPILLDNPSKIDLNNANFMSKLSDETANDKTDKVDEILQKRMDNEPAAVVNNSGANLSNNTYCRLGLDSDSNKGQIVFVENKKNDNNADKASSASNNASTSNMSAASVNPVSNNYIPVDKVVNYVPHRQFDGKIQKED